MTKAVAFLSAALLAATLGVAQDTSTSGTAGSQSSTSSTQSSSPASGQNSTIQGCLNSTSDNNFTLTQDQTGMVFTLSGSADQLKAHVGHEVAITGQQASSQRRKNDRRPLRRIWLGPVRFSSFDSSGCICQQRQHQRVGGTFQH